MINVSAAVASEINKLSRKWTARLLRASNSSEIQCDIKSLTIHKGACGTFSVGSIYVPYIELETFGNPTIDEEFKLQLGIDVSGTINYIDIGYFTVTSQKSTTNTIKFVAQGRLYGMYTIQLYNNVTETKTLQSIVDDVEEQGYTIVYKNGFTIPSASITTTWNNISCRDALQIVATCVGGFVTEDNAGNICLCKYNSCTTADLTIDGDRSTSEPEIFGEYVVDGCKVIVSDTKVFEEANANLEVTNPYFNEDMWDDYKGNLTGLTFDSASAYVTLGDPRLEAWDCVKITDNNDVDYMVPCLTLTWNFEGGLTMDIDADATLTIDEAAASGGPISKQLEELKNEVDGASSSLEATDMDVNVLYDITDCIKTTIAEVYSNGRITLDGSVDVMGCLTKIVGSTFDSYQLAKVTNSTNWTATDASFSSNIVTIQPGGYITSRYTDHPVRYCDARMAIFRYKCTGEAKVYYTINGASIYPYIELSPSSKWQTICAVYRDLYPQDWGQGAVKFHCDSSSDSAVQIKDLQIFLTNEDDLNSPYPTDDPNDFLKCFPKDVYFPYGHNKYHAKVKAIRGVDNSNTLPEYTIEIPDTITTLPNYGEASGLEWYRVEGSEQGDANTVDLRNWMKEYEQEWDGTGHVYNTYSLEIPDYFMQRLRTKHYSYIEFIMDAEEGGPCVYPNIMFDLYKNVDIGGGSGPSEYLKSASVSGSTLTLVDQDDEEVTFTATGQPSEYIKSASVSTDGNSLTLTRKNNTTLTFTPQGGGGGDSKLFEVVEGETTFVEIAEAIEAGKIPYMSIVGTFVGIAGFDGSKFTFAYNIIALENDTLCIHAGALITIDTDDVWDATEFAGALVPFPDDDTQVGATLQVTAGGMGWVNPT